MADMTFNWNDWKVNSYRTQYQREIIWQDIRPYEKALKIYKDKPGLEDKTTN